MSDFMFTIVVVWGFLGGFALLLSLIFLVGTWTDISNRGYALKDERQILRYSWLGIIGALLGPLSVVALVGWGLFMFGRVAKDTIGLAFGRSKVDD